MPVMADRSLFNSVTYDDAGALADALPALAELYARAGVRAWTVWCHDDPSAARALAAAGPVLDGEPELMCAPLEEIDLEPRGAGECAPVDVETFVAASDAGWELPPEGSFGPGIRGGPAGGMQYWIGFCEGVAAACAATLVHDGDCYVTFVSTLPALRGRGLAGEVMRAALRAAAEAGATTTSLEATALGRPVYARLGYRALGPAQMWERRAPQAS
jgi:ribosomal protein S18 acetylase RimI-like enzyme